MYIYEMEVFIMNKMRFITGMLLSSLTVSLVAMDYAINEQDFPIVSYIQDNVSLRDLWYSNQFDTLQACLLATGNFSEVEVKRTVAKLKAQHAAFEARKKKVESQLPQPVNAKQATGKQRSINISEEEAAQPQSQIKTSGKLNSENQPTQSKIPKPEIVKQTILQRFLNPVVIGLGTLIIGYLGYTWIWKK